MHKNAGIEFLRALPDDIETAIIEIATTRTVTMLVGVDMGANFSAAQAQFAHASFKFLRGQVGILKR